MNTGQSWKLNFISFWLTQAMSLLGSGLASFALVWWMTEKTGSATVLTTATLSALLPGILIAPLAGALVDRLNRRTIMVVSDAASACMALLIAVLFWTGNIQLWHIYLINAVRALAGAFQFPAVQSSTALLVPQKQLARIAGLNQALQGLNMVAMPPLGALLLSLYPVHTILGMDVLTAVLAIGLLLVVRIPKPESQPQSESMPATIWQDLHAGFAFLRRWPALLGVMGIASLLNLVLTPAFTLLPILVTQHFNGSAVHLGWINASYGAGIIAGGAILGVWGGFKRRVLTSLLGLVGLGAGSLLIGVTPSNAFGIALAGMGMVGMMNTFVNGPFFAVLQSIVPNEMQGRVFTVLMSVSMAMTPIGLALAGPIADRFAVQSWYVLGALICGLMAAWIVLNPALLHLEEVRMFAGDAEKVANG
jgi:DHA3 family macrolide efflux protein-like MFS transporter